MMVSEEAGTVQEDVTSTEASTQSENQGKVSSDETKSATFETMLTHSAQN